MVLEISDRLEQIVKENELHPFGGLQRRRGHYFRKNFTDHRLFNTHQNIVDDGYTYHYGGREELQFNFGWDKINGQTVFRYGVAFSLQASRSLPNPVEILKVQIDRFNKYVEDYPENFESCSYWVNEKNKSTVKFFDQVEKISDDLIEIGNFIFIGKYFRKESKKITSEELYEIVTTFDELMPVYEAVVLNNYFDKADERIVRLAWNTNNWEKPSGYEGKSSSKDTHEGKYGFGFEEWLFDKSKLIDGYMYGLLQPFHTKESDTFKLTKRNISLFTRDIHQKYWVGRINDVEIISDELANYAYKIFENKGWLEERRKDLLQQDINPDLINSGNEFINDAASMFNVRFKPDQIEDLVDELVPITDKEFNAIRTERYVPVKRKELPNKNSKSYVITSVDSSYKTKDFKSVIKRSTRTETKEYRNIHDEIQVSFCEWLIDNITPDELSVEHLTDDGRKLDIYMVKDGRKSIFEVKSYNSLKTSLKVGLGQLINYKYYPNLNQVDDIFLVSNINPSESIVEYVNHLNSELNLNFGYVYFDEIKNKLIKQVGLKFYDH